MKFLGRSLIILLALYGLVFAIGDVYLARSGASLWLAVAFPIVLVGFQYLIGPWLVEFLMDIFWDDAGTVLPQVNRDFVERLCAARGLKVPRIGIIYSGTPNAFSFGHLRSDARVVITKGLLEILTPEETNAVLAHEIGHIEHYDFAVMTIAALAPLVLYQFYIYTQNISNLRAIAYAAYLCYWVSQFIVLLLNRTREYFADHYAAEVTQTPDVLSSALVKIAYGMVKSDGLYKQAMKVGTKDEKSDWRKHRRLEGGLAVMGISNLRSGAALALGGASQADAAAVMKWDLVNPWARVYELNSTHPLTALRVKALNQQAVEAHQVPQYQLPPDRKLRWGWFPVEFVLWVAPFLAIIALAMGQVLPGWLAFFNITMPPNTRPLLLIFAGLTWILRVTYRYRGAIQDASIGTLIETLDVSEMKPLAVRIKGKILGQGLPGAFWSPDLILQDPTGIMFILYRQSIPFARYLFAVAAAEDFIGQDVTVEGWFRRGIRPYVEMSKIEGRMTHRTYSRWVQYALSTIAVTLGFMWLTGRL